MTFTTAEHWQYFSEFCRYELASGGPDPQLSQTGQMSQGCDWEELVWRGGCLIAVWNVPFAEVLWRFWPWERMQAEPDALLPWLQRPEHWRGIVTRIERRCVRRPTWMAEFLLGYREFVVSLPDLMIKLEDVHGRQGVHLWYDNFWDASLKVPRLGRYVALKLLEYFRWYCDLPELVAPDIRPKGGWSPRETLAVLFPDDAKVLLGGESAEELTAVNQAVSVAQSRLSVDYGINVDIFQIQVLLCEYRESYEGRRQYPGRSLDSELGYAAKAKALWGIEDSVIWPARLALFPKEHLGEVQGWDGPRKVLGQFLSAHNATWSDTHYDYVKTLASGDFSKPVPR